jgi:leader peptidase (prepilin peptidase) / N-methyltransferase
VTGTFVICGVLFGLAVGSFLNVVLYRAPRHLSVVRPGSFCPRCNHEISAVDNVPVLSWLFLRGRCRRCREPISIRYPLVEAGTAAAFAGIAATLRPLWGVPGFWAMSVTIAVVAVIDADHDVCPVSVPVTGTGIGIAAFVIGGSVTRHTGPASQAAFGLAAAGIVALTLGALSPLRDRLGRCGVFSLPAFGACAGWLGATPALIGTAVCVALVGVLTVARAGTSVSARSARTSETLPLADRQPSLSSAPPLAISLVAGLAAALVSAGIGA